MFKKYDQAKSLLEIALESDIINFGQGHPDVVLKDITLESFTNIFNDEQKIINPGLEPRTYYLWV